MYIKKNLRVTTKKIEAHPIASKTDKIKGNSENSI